MKHTPWERRWHRHPLIVSLISLMVGGGVIWFLQFKYEKSAKEHEIAEAEQKALINKRLAIVEELSDYAGRTMSYLRNCDHFQKVANNTYYTAQNLATLNQASQKELNDIYALQDKLELELLIYFSTPEIVNGFTQWKKHFLEAANAATIADKSGKSVEKAIYPYILYVKQDTATMLNLFSKDIPSLKNSYLFIPDNTNTINTGGSR